MVYVDLSFEGIRADRMSFAALDITRSLVSVKIETIFGCYSMQCIYMKRSLCYCQLETRAGVGIGWLP